MIDNTHVKIAVHSAESCCTAVAMAFTSYGSVKKEPMRA